MNTMIVIIIILIMFNTTIILITEINIISNRPHLKEHFTILSQPVNKVVHEICAIYLHHAGALPATGDAHLIPCALLVQHYYELIVDNELHAVTVCIKRRKL